MKVAGVQIRAAAVAYVVFEGLIILGSLLLALTWARGGHLNPTGSPLGSVNVVIMFVGIIATFFWCGLYDFRHRPTRTIFYRRLGIAFAIVLAGAWLHWGVIANERDAIAPFLIAFYSQILVARLGFELVSSSDGYRRRLLFLGVGKQAQRTAREVIDQKNRDHEVVGFLAEREEELGWRIGGRPVLGLAKDLERVVKEQRVDQVVVAVADRRRGLPLDALLRVRLNGVEVAEEAQIHEDIAGKIPVEDLRPSWMIFSKGFKNSLLRHYSKRIFDLVVAFVGIVCSLPVSVLAALAVKLDSPGPVIFSQKRVGHAGKVFTLYKFRSMQVDAEADGTARWATKDDPRVTRVGRFLRATRIDEIPQLWNVLRGDMSFVGPRPERPVFVDELREKIPYYDQRHAIKPGLTGWAQVRYRYGSDEADAIEKLRHDMFYIKHHGILFDIRILLETVRVVFTRGMAR